MQIKAATEKNPPIKHFYQKNYFKFFIFIFFNYTKWIFNTLCFVKNIILAKNLICNHLVDMICMESVTATHIVSYVQKSCK